MSYRRRCEAVANAEARVAERIRRARAEWAALRANRDSAAYPGAVVGGGLLLGTGLGLVTGTASRPASTPAASPSAASASAPSQPAAPSAGALAGLGVLLRAAQQIAPLLQAQMMRPDAEAETDVPPAERRPDPVGAADHAVGETGSDHPSVAPAEVHHD